LLYDISNANAFYVIWFRRNIFNIFVAVSGGYGTNFTLVDDRSVRYMVAMYSYNPTELSPNVDADVSVFCVYA